MDEEKTNEAEPKKPDLKASIQRMTECLEDVLANAKAALFLSKDMDRDGMKWVTLSKAVFDVHERSRMGWQGLVDPAVGTGGGAFFTKNKILDFVLANPPMVDIQPADEPIDPNAPQIAQGEEPWRKIGTDSVGVKNTSRLCQAWVVREGASVEVRAERQYVEGMQTNCWSLVATVDLQKALVGTVFGSVNRAKSVCQKLRNALIAVRLRGRHYRMNVQARKAKAAEEVPNA